jgi:hypothetical protein
MNTTMAPPGRHVHLDFDMDREHQFHYRSQGEDGHRVVLHRGDSITFTGAGDFSIWFAERSPFESPVLHSRHSFITTRVRQDAPRGTYAYTVEVMRDGQVFADPSSRLPGEGRPEILIEA